MPLRIALLVLASTAFAAPTQPKQDDQTKLVLKSVAERYKDIGSWEAKFIQEEKSPGFAHGIASEGFFKFALPNKFLMETTSPSLVKKFVSNGTQAAYIEDRGPNRKDRYFARKFSDARSLELERYLVFFRGLKKGTASFSDFDVTGQMNKPELNLTLTPKKESDFSEVKLNFYNAEKFPKELILKDTIGGSTTLKIVEARPLRKIESKWFDVVIPAGAKVE